MDHLCNKNIISKFDQDLYVTTFSWLATASPCYTNQKYFLFLFKFFPFFQLQSAAIFCNAYLHQLKAMPFSWLRILQKSIRKIKSPSRNCFQTFCAFSEDLVCVAFAIRIKSNDRLKVFKLKMLRKIFQKFD